VEPKEQLRGGIIIPTQPRRSRWRRSFRPSRREVDDNGKRSARREEGRPDPHRQVRGTEIKVDDEDSSSSARTRSWPSSRPSKREEARNGCQDHHVRRRCPPADPPGRQQAGRRGQVTLAQGPERRHQKKFGSPRSRRRRDRRQGDRAREPARDMGARWSARSRRRPRRGRRRHDDATVLAQSIYREGSRWSPRATTR